MGTTEDEMVRWRPTLKGHEFEPGLGDGEGQGSLASCSPWCQRVGLTERLGTDSEWEDHSNYWGKGLEVPRNWATAHFLAF